LGTLLTWDGDDAGALAGGTCEDGLPLLPAASGVTVKSLSQSVTLPGKTSEAVLPGG
jgi:hypothetical protein